MRNPLQVIADLVESLAGAVLLDTNFDMEEGMAVIARLLLPELQRAAARSESAPDLNRNVVALVHELYAKRGQELKLDNIIRGAGPDTDGPLSAEGAPLDGANNCAKIVVCNVVVDGVVVASGYGSSSKAAERAACLQALQESQSVAKVTAVVLEVDMVVEK